MIVYSVVSEDPSGSDYVLVTWTDRWRAEARAEELGNETRRPHRVVEWQMLNARTLATYPESPSSSPTEKP